jgi:hypothetical protein
MTEESASDLIDAKIASLSDWRGEMLARVRALIREADPEVVETRRRIEERTGTRVISDIW